MRLLASSLVLACALAIAGEQQLGKPLTLKDSTAIADLASSPAKYAGKTVLVKGKVTEVCDHAGCWMKLVDDNGKSVRIKVKDGEIVFPKEAIGKLATAEGKFAEASKGVWQVQGTGAVIHE